MHMGGVREGPQGLVLYICDDICTIYEAEGDISAFSWSEWNGNIFLFEI